TVESRAAGLDDATDAAGARQHAVAARAGLPGAVIDGEALLEIAELARGLDVVAQGRPAGLDRLAQDAADRLGEALRPLALHRAGEPLGRQAGPEQALRDIDVAESGDHLLVEQRRLDRRRLAGQRRGQHGSV